MKKIRSLIVDDEMPARGRLRRLLEPHEDVVIAGEAASGDEAIQCIGELKPDLLFLDVQMPPPDGISVLRTVRDEWLPCTIFTTAYAEHAVAAFEVHALDYLLKPFSKARFAEALDRARAHLASGTAGVEKQLEAMLGESGGVRAPLERFLVKTSARYIVVRAADITWIEAADNYVVLHTGAGNHVLRRTLTALEEELDPAQFFRTSRSCIVRLDAIAEIQTIRAGEFAIVLRDKTRVPLTRGLRELQDQLELGK